MLKVHSSSFARALTLASVALSSSVQLGCGGSKCGEPSLLGSYMGEAEECGEPDGGTSGSGGDAPEGGKGGTSGSGGKGGTAGSEETSACELLGAEVTDDPPPEEATGERVIVYEWGQTDQEGPLESQDWVVDNAEGVLQGATALHPPTLGGRDKATFTFDCDGAEHTYLSFAVHRSVDNAELELFDGETSRGVLQVGYDWATKVILVPPSQHAYRLVARNTGTTTTPSPPFVVDAISCKQAEPGAGHNQIVNFDDGFIPVELEGWFVDNLRGLHQGEAALHPPVLKEGDRTSMTFDCGLQEHT